MNITFKNPLTISQAISPKDVRNYIDLFNVFSNFTDIPLEQLSLFRHSIFYTIAQRARNVATLFILCIIYLFIHSFIQRIDLAPAWRRNRNIYTA